jgi:hypothetical protein
VHPEKVRKKGRREFASKVEHQRRAGLTSVDPIGGKP